MALAADATQMAYNTDEDADTQIQIPFGKRTLPRTFGGLAHALRHVDNDLHAASCDLVKWAARCEGGPAAVIGTKFKHMLPGARGGGAGGGGAGGGGAGAGVAARRGKGARGDAAAATPAPARGMQAPSPWYAGASPAPALTRLVPCKKCHEAGHKSTNIKCPMYAVTLVELLTAFNQRLAEDSVRELGDLRRSYAVFFNDTLYPFGVPDMVKQLTRAHERAKRKIADSFHAAREDEGEGEDGGDDDDEVREGAGGPAAPSSSSSSSSSSS